MTRTRTALCALALAVPLILAGCGGGSSSSDDGSTGASGAAGSDEMRQGAILGVTGAVDALGLPEPQRECMIEWASSLSDADLDLWLVEPLPEAASAGLQVAVVSCERDGLTDAATEALASQGVADSVVACAEEYLGSLSPEDFASLVVNGGTPEAIEAYADAVAACQTAG